jgi:Uma2 family endonuclease
MQNPIMSYAQYLELESRGDVKHEYLRGDVWAMAGGTPRHGRLAARLTSELGNALKGRPCVVYSSDVRIRIESTDRSTYPDLSVVCGEDRFAPDDANALVNPIIIVEVLSESTERSDRGEKFAHYQRLASLREYVLVDQERPRIEVFRRQGDSWLLSIHESGGTVRLESIEAGIEVDAVYADPRQ